jgi:hypothetical protein
VRPHGAACGRLGVDGFRQRTELHAPLFQIIQQDDQVAQAPAQPIEPHTTIVSPCSSFRRHLVRPGRRLTTPEIPSSRQIVVHPAFFSAASCAQGSDHPWKRGHGRISCPSFCTRYLQHPSPNVDNNASANDAKPFLRNAKTRADDESPAAVFRNHLGAAGASNLM